ncbi:MAG: hypothetical protein ABSB70_20625 [Candidatus Velthaea sp.]
MQKQIGIAAVGVAFLASGCSGGSSSSAVVPAAGKTAVAKGTTVKSKLTIKIPVRKRAASAKVSPKYISPSTSGLYIQAGVLGSITSSTPWQAFDVTPASSTTASPIASQQCTLDPTNTFTICTVTVTAPAVPGATDEFQIVATDWAPTPAQALLNTSPIGLIDEALDDIGANGAGEPIAAGATNAITVTLDGYVGRLQASPVSVWAAPGTSTLFDGYIQATDADYNLIAGNPSAFVNPIVVSGAAGTPISNFPDPSTLTPPATAAAPSIYAQMTYTAPPANQGMAPVTTVNVTAPQPAWIAAPTAPSGFAPQVLSPSTTLEIDPMTVNAIVQSNATPIGAIDLSNGNVTVMVNETNMATLTVTEQPSNTPLTATVTNAGTANASAQFTVLATDQSTSIVITDDRGTTATLPVGAPPPTTSALHRARV